MEPVNLEAKLAAFAERWSPRTVAQFNGHDVMLVKAGKRLQNASWRLAASRWHLGRDRLLPFRLV